MKGRRRRIFRKIYLRVVKIYGPLDTPCWIWYGPTSGSGRGGDYGRFSFEGVTASVHRTMFQLFHGPVAPKKQVDHLCRNRKCCNPYHLEQVTHKENQRRRDESRDGE